MHFLAQNLFPDILVGCFDSEIINVECRESTLLSVFLPQNHVLNLDGCFSFFLFVTFLKEGRKMDNGGAKLQTKQKSGKKVV